MEVPLDEARLTFETNLFSVVAITQAFIPNLISSKGLVLNIGSVAAIVPYVFGSLYNASKAALHSFSSTLRLELEPFDVDVLVVITGGVQSRIARTERVLKDDSLYLEIKNDYERRLVHSQDGAMDTDAYAKSVVAEAVKAKWRRRKWVWRGNRSFLIWFLSSFVGGWVFDLALPRMFGLDKLKRIFRSKRKCD